MQDSLALPCPPVLVVVPARNEAEVIAQTVSDILRQDYAGEIRLVLVNDNSQDATASIAEQAASKVLENLAATAAGSKQAPRSFQLVNGAPLPEGWSGKLWAVEQGLRAGLGLSDSAQLPTGNGSYAYIWLTDADIAHTPQVLRELIARARSDNRALVSHMARLCTDTRAERWTIPAFVYFFQMLYPFAAIANPHSRIYGAAGGCILLERAYLPKMGGISSLRGALIDDCTLATHVARAGGRLWLELTRSSHSQRGYGGGKGVSNMIARTAYTQLHYSPLRLLGTVLGLVFTFWCPLLLLLASLACLLCPDLLGSGLSPATAAASVQEVAASGTRGLLTFTAAAAATSLAIMLGTFIPMLRFYGQSPLRALALPLIATFYLDATIKSAIRHYQGKTGNWKGRVYQNPQ